MTYKNKIRQNYLINAPVSKVWLAFVDPTEIEKWGGSPAKMSDKPGEKFELWGGDVFGTNIEVVENKKLVQEWYGGNWTKSSKVVFIFENLGDKTKVILTHTNLPENEVENFDQGWKDYYLGAITTYLNGSSKSAIV